MLSKSGRLSTSMNLRSRTQRLLQSSSLTLSLIAVASHSSIILSQAVESGTSSLAESMSINPTTSLTIAVDPEGKYTTLSSAPSQPTMSNISNSAAASDLGSSPSSSAGSPTPSKGYDLFHGLDILGGPTFERVTDETTQNLDIEYLVCTHTLPDDSDDLYETADGTLSLLNQWLRGTGVEIYVVNTRSEDEAASPDVNACVDMDCSPVGVCQPALKCLFATLVNAADYGDSFHWNMTECSDDIIAYDWTKDGSSWRCPLYLYSLNKDPNQGKSCNIDVYQKTTFIWKTEMVDSNLATAINGGADSDGILWVGAKLGETFSETFNRQIWDISRRRCSLANPCAAPEDCNTVGTQIAVALGSANVALKQPWTFLAATAIGNLNKQLTNMWNEMQNGILSLSSDSFSIDDFYRGTDQQFDVRNALAGAAGMMSILGGFIPIAGPAISAGGTVASTVGSLFSNAISASTDVSKSERTFANNVEIFYQSIRDTMDDFVTKLFAGEKIAASNQKSFDIMQMLEGGAWVDPDVLTPVSDLNKKVRMEVYARSINHLWKEPPYNKMWVTFVDLQEGNSTRKCEEAPSGPRDSKYR